MCPYQWEVEIDSRLQDLQRQKELENTVRLHFLRKQIPFFQNVPWGLFVVTEKCTFRNQLQIERTDQIRLGQSWSLLGKSPLVL